MPTSSVVVSGSLPTSGAVNLTSSGFGTPTAALIVVSNANTTNNPQDIATTCVGFWTSGTQGSACLCQSDGDADSDAGSYYSTSAAVTICNDDGTLIASYTVASTTDGLTFTLASGSPSLARYISVLMFAGTANVYIGSRNLGTGTTAQDITAPGFQPHLLVALTTSQTAAGGSTNGNFSIGLASITNAGAVTQGAAVFNNRVGRTSTETYSALSNTYIGGKTALTGVDWSVLIESPDASGFSFKCSASAGSTLIQYLAIKFDDENDAHLHIGERSTATGDVSYTGAPKTPQSVFLVAPGWRTTLSTARSSTAGFSLGMASASAQFCHTSRDAENSTTTDSDSQYYSTKLLVAKGSTAVDCEATLVSFNSNGYTLNWSDAANAANPTFLLLIGAGTAAAPTLSDVKAASITATTVQGTYDYAF